MAMGMKPLEFLILHVTTMPCFVLCKTFGIFFPLSQTKKEVIKVNLRISRQNFYREVIISMCCYAGVEMFRTEENASLEHYLLVRI